MHIIESGEKPTPTRFDVEAYLAQRDADPNFVMVEIGHDSLPVAYQQPVEFRGKRAYIGIEGWLRDPIGVKGDRLSMLRATKENDQNIFYISQNLGGAVLRNFDESRHSAYGGSYDPTTNLPAGAASEVFISNVFCDPHIAFSIDRTISLLGEAARIVSHDGMIVIRDTITPNYVNYLSDELFIHNGLKVVTILTPGDDSWPALEVVFKGEPSNFIPPRPDSRYVFLAKAA